MSTPLENTGVRETETIQEYDLTKFPVRNSLTLVAERIEKYKQLVSNIETYTQDHLTIISTCLKMYEKLHKNGSLESVVRFEVDPEGLQPVTGSNQDTENDLPSRVQDINSFFNLIQDQTERSIKRSQSCETSIKGQILPQLKALQASLTSKLKEFNHTCQKQEKDFKMTIQATSKDLEHFDLSITKAELLNEHTRPDFRHDPYLNKRIVYSQAEKQLSSEQEFTNFISKSESDLELLEVHTIQELKQIFNQLSTCISELYHSYGDEMTSANEYFKSIPDKLEWSRFQRVYSDKLMRSSDDESIDKVTGFSPKSKRTIETIQFNNKDHFLTVPILEGILSRKDGKFSSKMSSHYYVITKSRLLFEFPSRASSSSQPSVVLFLPDCSLKQSTDTSSHRFKLHGKDLSSSFIKSSKTLVFEASSDDELKTWFNVISELSGLMYSNQDQDIESN
uniref:PH domain-containing protein n=1 Tax=Ogataea thermomethanolica (nom. inval.) TaxID=310468 RepID=A0A5P8D0T5_9ASCO|nr:hypothetical protein [Ogataea thermomethanolica (nom. inval.)]QGW56828.1 hypothetical protein [Ogataea thermomethanolica (nom. inval.)]